MSLKALKSGSSAFFALVPIFIFLAFYMLSAIGASVDTVDLISPADGSYSKGANDTIAFTFSYAGDGGEANCTLSLNGTASGTITANVSESTQLYANDTLSEGTYYWQVNCTNETTAENASSSLWMLHVDRNPSDVSWISPTSDGTEAYNKTYIEWNISVTDDIGICLFEINGTSNYTATFTENVSSSSYCYYNQTDPADFQGNVTYCALGYASDAAGNMNATLQQICRNTDIHQAYTDDDAPDLNFVLPTLSNESYTQNASWVYVNVTGYETLSSCILQNGTQNLTATVDGFYCYYNMTGQSNNTVLDFMMYANDTAGNLNATEWRRVTVNLTDIFTDSDTPDLNFVSPTLSNNSYTQNASWVYVNVTGYETLSFCILQNGTQNITMTVTDSSCWYNMTGQSNNTQLDFMVYGNDSLGNLNTTAWRRITVNMTDYYADSDAPDLSFAYPTPNNETTTANYTYVNVTLDEAGYCLLDWNGINVTMSSPTALPSTQFYSNRTLLANGNYSFSAWCNDTAGNLNRSEMRWVYVNWTAPDTDTPTVTIIYPENISYVNVTYFTFTATDMNIESCWYTADGGTTNTTTTCNATTPISLTSGQKTLEVYSNDSSGNIGGDSVTFTHYQNPPSVSIIPPTAGDGASTTESNITINVSVFSPQLTDLSLDWNGTNTTFYDAGLILMLNFDNAPDIGENDSLVVDSSPYGNDGNAENVSFVRGSFGNAVYLQNDSSVIDITDSNEFHSENFTISLRINVSADSIKQISAFGFSTCIFLYSGEVYCVGDNAQGQLGDGSTANRGTPVKVITDYDISELSNSGYPDNAHQCGILTNGSAVCWGDNANGQLGDSSTTDRTTPKLISGNYSFSDISCGRYHTCGLLVNGTVLCWGSNSLGALGDNTTTQRTSPTSLYYSDYLFRDISAGDSSTCGVLINGTGMCWGRNDNGALGNNDTNHTNVPVAVYGNYNFSQLFNGNQRVYGLLTNGSVVGWGGDATGVTYGIGDSSTHYIPAPLYGNYNFTYIENHYSGACGILTNGSAVCWGSNLYSILGDGTTANSEIPVYVSGDYNFSNISLGTGHGCGILTSGSLMCWGNDRNNQLGKGVFSSSFLYPILFSHGNVSDTSYKNLSLGQYHACGVLYNGYVKCWGRNQYGQLGDNSTTDSNIPVYVSGNYNFSEVSSGGSHTCGLLVNGSAMCWGRDVSGVLGCDSCGDSTVPTYVSGGYNFSKIAISTHSCGLLTNGSLLCWGANTYGQLGNGSFENSDVPIFVSGNYNFSSMSLGSGFTCGLLVNGTGLCWGRNQYGQIGNGTTGGTSTVPQNIFGSYDWVSIKSGAFHSCGLLANGSLLCWGYNADGQMGDGTTVSPKNTPTFVSGDYNFSNFDLSLSYHTCGIITNGSLLCWGRNIDGQLGDGTQTYKSAPVLINTNQNISNIYSGISYSFGILSDGRIISWGNNAYGQQAFSNFDNKIPTRGFCKGNLFGKTTQSFKLSSSFDGGVFGYSSNSFDYLSLDSGYNHVVISFDGTAGKIYKNGYLANTFTTPSLSYYNDSSDILIGNNSWGTQIDEIRMWNRTLTNFEVKQVCESNLMRINQTYWNFYMNSTNLTAGTYNYTIYADNSVGSGSESRGLYLNGLDTTSPEISFISPTPSNETTTNNYTYINLTISEPGYCLLGWAGTNESMSNSTQAETYYANKTLLTNGNYSFTAWCNDSAGNLNRSEMRWVYVNWTAPPYDAPDLNFVLPTLSNESYTQNASWVYVNVTGYETLSSCILQNGTQNLTATVDGFYCYYNMTGQSNNTVLDFMVYANDTAGNLNATEWRRVTVNLTDYYADTTPPQITISSPLNTTYGSRTAYFNVTLQAGESGSWCGYSLDGAANATMAQLDETHFWAAGTPLADGQHNATFHCNDSMGGMNGTSVYFSVNHDAKKVILIGVDGMQYNHYVEMNASGQLGNITRLIGSGGWAGTANITGHASTETAPGNAEIHTGLNENLTGVSDNSCANPIPPGNTTFERVEAYDPSIATGFVYGKTKCYVPNGLLDNAMGSVDWWHNSSTYNNTAWPDRSPTCTYGQNVSTKAAEFIGNHSNGSFYLVVYYGEPDCSGHQAGENSTNYTLAFLNVDASIGMLLDFLVDLGINDTTQILLIADHGWNDNTTGHATANSDTIILPLMTNNASLVANITSDGIRGQCEVAPTILKFLGVGQSYYQDVINNGCDSMMGAPDGTPPQITVAFPQNTTYPAATVYFNVTLQAGENGFSCSYALDGEANVTMAKLSATSFWHVNASMTNGLHAVIFTCEDFGGNTNSSSIRYFTVDTDIQSVSITYPQNTTYYNATYVDFDVGKPPNTCWYSLNGGPNATMACANGTAIPTAEGQNTLTVYANDSLGNNASDTVYFTTDWTAPTLSFVSPSSNNSYTQNASYVFINVSATEPLSACILQNGTQNITMNVSGTSCFYNMTGQSNQTQLDFQAYANDTAGNMNATGWRRITVNMTYTYPDTTPPDVTVVSPQNRSYQTQSVYFNVSVSEPASWCGYSLDNQTNVTMTETNSTWFGYFNASLTGGSHTVRFYCNDTAGNMNASADATAHNTVTFFVSEVTINNCSSLGISGVTYKLANDVNSTEDCFTIAANNVTLDCQGNHIIYGNQTGSTYYGIILNFNNATIRNCTISRGTLASQIQSRYGLYSASRNGHMIEFVNASYNRYGLYFISTSNTTILNVTADNNYEFGIYGSGFSNNTVVNSKMSGNGYGFYTYACSNMTFRNNNMSGNSFNFNMHAGFNGNAIDATNIVDYSFRIYYNDSISDYTLDGSLVPDVGTFYCIDCNNVTIRNLNLSHKNSEGLFFEETTNSTVENLIARYNYIGLNITDYSTGNNLTNITTSDNSGMGISLQFESSNNTFTGIKSDNEMAGFYIYNGYYNNIENLIMDNCSTGSSASINIITSYPGRNVLKNAYIKNGNIGIEIDSSDYNMFRDLRMVNMSGYDVNYVGQPNNNIFLNATYDEEYVSSSPWQSLIRKWYVSVNVTNSTGNSIDTSNVTVYNSSYGYLELINYSTISIGGIYGSFDVTEYVDSSGEMYYTNYTLYVNDTTGTYQNHTESVNFSYNVQFNVTLYGYVDSAPVMTFVYPTPNNETVTANYTYVNVTLNEAGYCLLDWNGSNSSMTNSTSLPSTLFYSNRTLLPNGNYTFSAWCNDTMGNLNRSEMRWVYVNWTAPPYDTLDLSFAYPTPANLSYTQNASYVYVNVTGNANFSYCMLQNGTQNISMSIQYYMNSTPQMDMTYDAIAADGTWNTTHNYSNIFNGSDYAICENAGSCYANVTVNYTKRPYMSNNIYVESWCDNTWVEVSGDCFAGDTLQFKLVSAYDPYQATVACWDGDEWLGVYSCSNPISVLYARFYRFGIQEPAYSSCYYNMTGQSNNTVLDFQVYAAETGSNINASEWMRVTINLTSVVAYDTDAPDLNFLLPASNGTVTQNASYVFINVTADEMLSSCILQNGTQNVSMTAFSNACWYNMTGQSNQTQLDFMVYGNDTSGNMNTTEWRRVTVNLTDSYSDSDAPGLSFAYPTLSNNSYTQNQSWIYVNVSSDEALSSCFFSNSTHWLNMTVSGQHCYINLTGLSNQTSNYFQVYANDTSYNLNNTEWRNITVNLTAHYDANPPYLDFISPTLSNNSYTQNQSWVYVNVTGYETLSSCILQNGTQNLTAAVDGFYCYYNMTGQGNLTQLNFRMWANATSGKSNYSEWRRITVNITSAYTPDTTPPDIAISLPLNATVNYDNFNFTYSGDINCSSYSLDGGANVTNCSIAYSPSYRWTGTLSVSSDGTHNVTVYANDSDSNANSTTRHWTRDTNAPDIHSVSNATIYPIRAYISWNTTEGANASVTLSTNASQLLVNASNSSLLSFRNLTIQYLAKNATYYYNVTSCDAAGNCNTSGPYSFTTPDCNASVSCGSWSTCSSSSQSRTCTDASQCAYPWETTETQSCTVDEGNDGGGSTGGGTVVPPANVSSRPQLVPGRGIINNTKLEDAIEKVIEKGNLSASAKENLLRLSESITADTEAFRNVTYSSGKTRFQTRLMYSGTSRAKNFMVYEKLPKAFAARARDVTVTCHGASVVVVEDDPSWLITYPDVVPGQELLITYEAWGAKPSSVANLTQTEIYAETLSTMPPPEDEVPPTTPACTAATWRCSGALLEECSASGSWTVLETCDYGCDDVRHACLPEPQANADWLSGPSLPDKAFAIGAVLFTVFIITGAAYTRMGRKKEKKAAPAKKVAQKAAEKQKPAEAKVQEKKAPPEERGIQKHAGTKVPEKKARQKAPASKETHLHPPSEISEDIRDGEPDVAIASVAAVEEGATHKAGKKKIGLGRLVEGLKSAKSRISGKDAGQSGKIAMALQEKGAVKGGAMPDIAIATLSGVHGMIKAKGAKGKVPRNVTEADRKVEEMGKILHNNVPQLKSSIDGMKKGMDGQGKAATQVRDMEKSIREEMAEIRDSISTLRDVVVKKSMEKGVESHEIEGIVEKAADDINEKVGYISFRMERTFEDLKQKIEKTTQESRTAVSEPLEELKRDIESIRSQLPNFIMKKELATLSGGSLGQPGSGTSGTGYMPPARAPPKGSYEGRWPTAPAGRLLQEKTQAGMPAARRPPGAVAMADVKKHLGRQAQFDCSLVLFKSLEEPGMSIYWYRATDESGTCILTSREKIAAARARLLAAVRKTEGGTIYLEFMKLL